ncbi:hypothetical protein AZE42_11224 [Rhizopogon vesiculosus]|uniref:Uncharacterized protein n=1 Tax=Rhizopogon vesiculosus TaxID=180088 RepID=A0A1J8PN62_9AGAM|nr:hypothetical protein AZE42_11224 [Rhizopogon vesiculosus]
MAETEETRATINRLLLVNALTEGALEEMMDNPEYFDADDEFLGDLNCTDALGNTALHLAVRQGHPADVAALCAGPVDLDIHNKSGDTPLHVALKGIEDTGKRFEIVKELLSCGAEHKHIMPGGLTPLEYAKSRFPSDRDLHEIIAEPPHSDEEEDEPQLEQTRKQMYDSSDFAEDDEVEGEGSSSETE